MRQSSQDLLKVLYFILFALIILIRLPEWVAEFQCGDLGYDRGIRLDDETICLSLRPGVLTISTLPGRAPLVAEAWRVKGEGQ